MAREELREVEVIIRFKNNSGEQAYDRDMDSYINESARILAETLKKHGYKFQDRQRMDAQDPNKMRRNFIVLLHGRQTEDELRPEFDTRFFIIFVYQYDTGRILVCATTKVNFLG